MTLRDDDKPEFVGRACVVMSPGGECLADLLPDSGKAFVKDYVAGMLAVQSMHPCKNFDDNYRPVVWVDIRRVQAIIPVVDSIAHEWQDEARWSFGF